MSNRQVSRCTAILVLLWSCCCFKTTTSFLTYHPRPHGLMRHSSGGKATGPFAAVSKSRSPRIGGRSKRRKIARKDERDPNKNNGWSPLIWLFILCFGLFSLFGSGGNPDTSYYYYESSSFTTIMNGQEVQTQRQETFKTNIPNLRPSNKEISNTAAFEQNLDTFMQQLMRDF